MLLGLPAASRSIMPRKTARDTIVCFSVMMIIGTITAVVEGKNLPQIFEMVATALLFTTHYAFCCCGDEVVEAEAWASKA